MDKFILREKDYNQLKKLKLEKEERKDREYADKNKNKDKYEKEAIQYNTRDMKIKYQFQSDFFHIRENGDIQLNKWIIQQKDPIIIFLSEFIQGTKISKEMERFRPIIKTTPTISVEEYRKKKKIGTEGQEYLKRLKDKYGVIVLKVLWANLNF